MIIISGRSFQKKTSFCVDSTYPGPRYAEMTFVSTVLVEPLHFAGCDLFSPCLWSHNNKLQKCALYVNQGYYESLTRLYCYYDLYRKYPRYTQVSPPHGPRSGRFLLYCTYQYKQKSKNHVYSKN